MTVQDDRRNPLATLLNIKPEEISSGHRAHRDLMYEVPSTTDANAVKTSLDARRAEFKQAAAMLFHPETDLTSAANGKLRDLVPAIIRHHQQLRTLRRSEGSFELAPAFCEALRSMAQPGGELLRPAVRGRAEGVVTPQEFARGVRSMCSHFRSDPHQDLITTLKASHWLSAPYRNELSGVQERQDKANPRLQAARKLLQLD